MENEKIARWTWDIFRWIRPHHIIKTFKYPKRAIREIKYRYTFTSKARFAVDILSVPRNLVSSALYELHSGGLSSKLKGKN